MRYRKLPVEIEAFEMTPERCAFVTVQSAESGREAMERLGFPQWLQNAWDACPEEEGALWTNPNLPKPYLYIGALEGHVVVSVGDFIIRGVQGDLYPCKPEIFRKTYEKVEDFVSIKPCCFLNCTVAADWNIMDQGDTTSDKATLTQSCSEHLDAMLEFGVSVVWLVVQGVAVTVEDEGRKSCFGGDMETDECPSCSDRGPCEEEPRRPCAPWLGLGKGPHGPGHESVDTDSIDWPEEGE